MSQPIEASQRANSRRSIGLRTLLFLYSAVLVGLATLGALGVVIAYRHRAEEDTSRLVLRAAMSRAEWEARGALGGAEEFLLLMRDWVDSGFVAASDVDALEPLLAPMLAPPNVFGGVHVVAGDVEVRMSPQLEGWNSSVVARTDGAVEPPWLTEALMLCRARDDDNLTGNPDVAWMPPEDGAETGPFMMVAMAFGQAPQEVCVAIALSLPKLADVFVGLLPTPAGVTAVITDSGRVLGLTGFRYVTAAAGARGGVRAVQESGNPGLARAYERWSSNKGEGVFDIVVNEQVVWASFRELMLGKNGKIVVGAVAPREDVTLLMRQTEQDVVLMGFWGLAGAALLAWSAGTLLRRPLLVLADHLGRRDVVEGGQRYWPRTRVTEMRNLMEAVDALSRTIDSRPPLRPGLTPAAATRTDTGVPQAQLQALFVARKELRETRALAVELQRGLRASEGQTQEMARHAEEQRGRLRALSQSEAFLKGDLAGMAALFAAAAAPSLGAARASLWKCEEDGVFLCLDRFDVAEGKHSAGAMLSRAEHRELMDAMALDPAVGIADLSAARWMQRLSGALGASPAPSAILACPVRSSRGIVAMTLFEHTGGVRAWSADEENQAIVLTQLLTPLFQETALEVSEPGPAEIAGAALRETQALWLLNADGKVTWVSERMLEWTDKEETDAIGCVLFELLDGMEARPLKEAWQSLRAGAPHARIEAGLEYPDRTARQLRVDLAAVRGTDGAFRGAAGLAVDVTNIRDAETAARDAEAHCRALLDHVPAVLWTADATGYLTYVNEAVRRVYGYTPAALIGKSFAALSSGECGPADVARIVGLVESGSGARWYAEHQKGDGTPVEVLITMQALRDGLGEPAGAAGTVVAVDELSHLEDAGHLLRFLGGRDEYIVLGVDRNGMILWLSVSPELQERYENDLRGMMGQSLLFYFRSQRIEEQIETFGRAVESHTVVRTVFAAQYAGGSYEQEATYIPLPEEGETAVVLIFIRDVTASTS